MIITYFKILCLPGYHRNGFLENQIPEYVTFCLTTHHVLKWGSC